MVEARGRLIARSRLLVFIIGLGAIGSGCTTTMTSMTDARAYEPKEVQVAANMQATAHSNIVNGVAKSVDSAIDEFGEDDDMPITEESFRQWLDLVILAALFRPSTSPELIARVGVTDKVLEGIDVGLRTNFSIFKGDVKLQVWENKYSDQFVSVMAGYAYHRSWVDDWISYITLTDFGRHDFDLQAMWGMEVGQWAKVNLGPHVIFSRIKAEHRLSQQIVDRLPDEVKKFDPNQLFENEWIGYYGGNANVMLGYKYAYVAADLGVFWMQFRPTVVGEQRDYSGVALSIAGGLSLHYTF
ncbi:MAG: hypothetical protein VX475_01815 [Myxococcota bacterium]|nr:hypothetical protein [Myxococcota bacterium]